MPGSLRRLLRVRAMQEELARMELEAQAARLRALERLASEAGVQALGCRERWFLAVERESAGDNVGADRERAGGEPERLAEEAAWELAASRRGLLEARRPAQASEVEHARAGFLDGRRERMTVESLVEAAANLELLEEQRRVQRGLDDWYQARLWRREGADSVEDDPGE